MEEVQGTFGTEINAKIKNADIILANNGEVTTVYLNFIWDNYEQGLPIYKLDPNMFMNWIQGIMNTIEVSSWSEVQGKYCRIIRDKEDATGNIVAIKNIINGKQFKFYDSNEEVSEEVVSNEEVSEETDSNKVILEEPVE